MVSLVFKAHRQRRWTNARHTAWEQQPLGIRHSARADSDEWDAGRACAPAVGRASGSGAEWEAEKAQTKDGACGGPECCNMRRYLCDGRGLD